MHILPISAKFIKLPIFVLFCFLASPYFDHDAFTHHALHVLDASVRAHVAFKLSLLMYHGYAMLHFQFSKTSIFHMRVLYHTSNNSEGW